MGWGLEIFSEELRELSRSWSRYSPAVNRSDCRGADTWSISECLSGEFLNSYEFICDLRVAGLIGGAADVDERKSRTL